MKAISRTIVLLTVLLIVGCCTARADIKWTLDDVYFTNGNSATGYFITDDAVTTIESFDITVAGGDAAAAFVAAIMVDSYLPNEIGIANSDWSKYVDLLPTSPLTSAGGIVPLDPGYDCPGCGVLRSDTDFHPTVNGASLPEPSVLTILASFGLVLGSMVLHRRRS